MSPTVYPEDEASWLSWVRDTALWARPAWRVYHTHNSKHSAAGFPDLTMVRGPRLIFAELKTDAAPAPKLDSPNATLRAQAEWLRDLAAVVAVECYVWRPADRPEIGRILR